MKVYARTPLDVGRVHIPQGDIYVIPERCKGCEICVRFCPKDILQVSASTNSKGYHYPDVTPGKAAECVHCQFCTLVCPEFAIYTLPKNGAS